MKSRISGNVSMTPRKSRKCRKKLEESLKKNAKNDPLKERKIRDKYFVAINFKKYGWILNPFSANAEMSPKFPYHVRENFSEAQNNRTLRSGLSVAQLDAFCISVK